MKVYYSQIRGSLSVDMRLSLGFLILPALVACENDDLGTFCPMEVTPIEQPTDPLDVSFPSVVEVNTRFPCDALVCVSTLGREPYCSRECVSDSNCPSAFVCETVTELEPFAERSYCVWRPCTVQLECGDTSRYDCIQGNYGPDTSSGLCGLIQGGG